MKSIVAAFAAFAFAVVSAQQTGIVSVSSPIKGTVFTAGEDAIISWNPDTARVDTIDQIQLAAGDPNNLSLLDVIATDVDASEGSYTWSVPEDIDPSANYAIVFGSVPEVAYSPQFTIAGPDGSLPSSSAVSSAVQSSAAPSASSAPSSKPSSSAIHSSAVRSASASRSRASASKTASASATPSNSAGTQSKPAAVAALAIVGAAAMAMI